MITGIIASSGIALGKAWLISDAPLNIKSETIKEDDVENHLERFIKARQAAVQQLTEIKKDAADKFGLDKEQIFEAHQMLLEDEELENDVVTLIKNDHLSVESAVESVISQNIEALSNIDDEYLKERATDMRDIGDRLLKNILGLKTSCTINSAEPVIIIANDLAPSQTAQFDLTKVHGFVINKGGPTSHTAIMARSLELPAIVGSKTVTESVKEGDWVLLDAINNRVLINPNDHEKKSYYRIKKAQEEKRKAMAALKDLKAMTKDGHEIELAANIGSIDDVKGALRNGADGVGLFRTEFLFMNRDALPSEDEQFETYKRVAEKMEGKPVLLRTLDIGGDKPLPYLKLPKEDNPFLGWRAIRFCFDHPEIFMTQIRAILRASAYGNVKIMFPMVIALEEVHELKSMLAESKKQLEQENIAFNPEIEIGLIIETPAAAVMAEHLIELVDFFSIGTNDLTQYTLAVDRGNEKIARLYQPLSPSILRLIHMTIETSHRHNKWTGICGELAADPKAFLLLLGMGMDEFSMSASSILALKQIIIHAEFKELQALSKRALAKGTRAEIDALIEAYLSENPLV